MPDTEMADRPSLEMRWVPVTDELGATRMQAVWIDATVVATPAIPHHAAA